LWEISGSDRLPAWSQEWPIDECRCAQAHEWPAIRMRREHTLPCAWPGGVLTRQSPGSPCVVRRSAWSPGRAEIGNESLWSPPDSIGKGKGRSAAFRTSPSVPGEEIASPLRSSQDILCPSNGASLRERRRGTPQPYERTSYVTASAAKQSQAYETETRYR